MSPKFRSFFLSAAALLVTLTVGCTDAGGPTAAAPAASPLSSAGGVAPDLDVLARFNKKPMVTIAWAKKWIGPEGGRLDFLGFAVEVPPGAVSKVTMFSIKLPVDPNGSERVVAEFGPHGSKFSKPVFIEFPYAGTSIYGSVSPSVVWWNGGWVDMGASVTTDGQRLRTTTDHFSTYGTTAELRGGQYTSGG